MGRFQIADFRCGQMSPFTRMEFTYCGMVRRIVISDEESALLTTHFKLHFPLFARDDNHGLGEQVLVRQV